MQAKQIDSKDNCSVCGGTHYGSLECPTLAGLRQRCISKFCEEEIPIFRQGEPEHELEDFVTAADCTYWVAEIKRLRLREAKAVELLTATAYTTDQDLEKFEEWIMERDEWLAYVDRKALTAAFAELDSDPPGRPS